MSPKVPYITRPSLSINEKGLWYQGASLIENKAVLRYFKKQLYRDREGAYYIENIFGSLQEHAYLDCVLGFPLEVRHISILLLKDPHSLQIQAKELLKQESFPMLCMQAQLDSGEDMLFAGSNLYLSQEDLMSLVLRKRGGLPARLSPGAMLSLRNYLYQNEQGAYFLTFPGEAVKQAIQYIDKRSFFWQS